MAILLALLATVLVTGAALAATISLSTKSVSPNASLKIVGTGFGDTEIVALAIDAANLAQATADPAGGFVATIQVPADTKIGKSHLVTATGQTSSLSASKPIWVRTEWAQVGYDATNANCSYNENVLNTGNVASLRKYWEVPIAPSPHSATVYYGSGTRGAVFVNTGNAIQALHPGNGQTLWTWNVPAPGFTLIEGIPVASSNRVYVRDRSGTLTPPSAAPSTPSTPTTAPSSGAPPSITICPIPLPWSARAWSILLREPVKFPLLKPATAPSSGQPPSPDGILIRKGLGSFPFAMAYQPWPMARYSSLPVQACMP